MLYRFVATIYLGFLFGITLSLKGSVPRTIDPMTGWDVFFLLFLFFTIAAISFFAGQESAKDERD